MGVIEWCSSEDPEPQPQRAGSLEACGWITCDGLYVQRSFGALTPGQDYRNHELDPAHLGPRATRSSVTPFCPTFRHEPTRDAGEVAVEDLALR